MLLFSSRSLWCGGNPVSPTARVALSEAESAGPGAGGRLVTAKAAENPVKWPGRSLSVRKNAYIPRKTSKAFFAGRGGTVERAYFRRQAETSDAELVPTRTGRGPFSFLKRKWGAEPFPCGQGSRLLPGGKRWSRPGARNIPRQGACQNHFLSWQNPGADGSPPAPFLRVSAGIQIPSCTC